MLLCGVEVGAGEITRHVVEEVLLFVVDNIGNVTIRGEVDRVVDGVVDLSVDFTVVTRHVGVGRVLLFVLDFVGNVTIGGAVDGVVDGMVEVSVVDGMVELSLDFTVVTRHVGVRRVLLLVIDFVGNVTIRGAVEAKVELADVLALLTGVLLHCGVVTLVLLDVRADDGNVTIP